MNSYEVRVNDSTFWDIQSSYGLEYCEDIEAYTDEYYYIEDEMVYIHDLDSDNYRYHYCEHCGNYYSDDSWNFHHDCCIDCAPERENIKDYHDGHDNGQEFFDELGETATGTRLFIGQELEVEHIDGSYELDEDAGEVVGIIGYDYCHIEEDSSLDEGFEIISQAFTERGFKNFYMSRCERAMKYLSGRGFRSHDGGNCGLHLHFSREWFGNTDSEQHKNAHKLVKFFNMHYDILKKIARREKTGYCRKNESDFRGGHGCAINTANYSTVEIRLGRGTLNTQSYEAWCDLCINIVKNIKHTSVDDWHGMINGISEDTKAYIENRTNFVGTNTEEAVA